MNSPLRPLWPMLLVGGLVLLLLPASAWAQWDADAYDVQARECVSNLRFARTAVDGLDTERARTYMQLADAPCQSARMMIEAAISSDQLSRRERNARLTDYVSQEAAWITLATEMGYCDEARAWLQSLATVVTDIPDAVQERYIHATQAVLTCGASGISGTVGGDPLYGTVTSGPGWPVQTAAGNAGGPLDASLSFGQDAWGFITQQPTFTVQLTGATQLWIDGDSVADLVMVVQGPDGTYFNDDTNGLMPQISGYFSAGTHNVWVGTFNQMDVGAYFTATISLTAPVPTPTQPALATYGTVYISPGAAAQEYSGYTAGVLDLAMLTVDCYGYIPDTPSFTMNVSVAGTTSVEAFSDYGDLVMFLDGPGGSYCNDDFSGLNPAISTYLSPGEYSVYIGEYSPSGAGSTFTARFSTNDLNTTLPAAIIPTNGTVYMGAGYAPQALTATSGGTQDAQSTHGSHCRGGIPDTPQFVLNMDSAANVSVTVQSIGDTTLVIAGPSGTFCNDDTNGVNPAISQNFPVGTYQIFVGSYQADERHAVTATFSTY